MDPVNQIRRIPEEADRISSQHFPDSARDGSTRNAFRHALGTGMLADKIGMGYIGSVLAKRAGYLWEIPQQFSEKYRNDPALQEDMLHDLNANAIGADMARQTDSQEELVRRLKQMAQDSRTVKPPSAWQRSPGYMTRTVR